MPFYCDVCVCGRDAAGSFFVSAVNDRKNKKTPSGRMVFSCFLGEIRIL